MIQSHRGSSHMERIEFQLKNCVKVLSQGRVGLSTKLTVVDQKVNFCEDLLHLLCKISNSFQVTRVTFLVENFSDPQRFFNECLDGLSWLFWVSYTCDNYCGKCLYCNMKCKSTYPTLLWFRTQEASSIHEFRYRDSRLLKLQLLTIAWRVLHRQIRNYFNSAQFLNISLYFVLTNIVFWPVPNIFSVREKCRIRAFDIIFYVGQHFCALNSRRK